jgi:hypothetical protein
MKNSFYVSFGTWIAILPFLGIPGSWRNMLVFVSGIFLVLVSIGPTILQKLQTKPKSKPRKRQKKTEAPSLVVSSEGQEFFGTENNAPETQKEI